MERPKSLQELQDAYGYVVMGISKMRSRLFKVGDIVTGFAEEAGEGIMPAPMVIVGFSTLDEWRAQVMESDGHFDEGLAQGYDLFLKLRAE